MRQPYQGLGLAVLVAASAGCVGESVYTTAHLPVPVMIGPIRSIGSTAPAPGRPMTAVEEQVTQFFFVSSHSHTNRRGYTRTRTSAAWFAEGSSLFDEAFGEASLTCPVCTPVVNRIDVGAYSIFLIGTIVEKNWAALDGALVSWGAR
jgi:hypothetical protein